MVCTKEGIAVEHVDLGPQLQCTPFCCTKVVQVSEQSLDILLYPSEQWSVLVSTRLLI